MTHATKAMREKDESKTVQFRILVFVIGVGTVWRLWSVWSAPIPAPEPVATPPPASALLRPPDPPPAAERGWEHLRPSDLWQAQADAEPAPPDPLVHCGFTDDAENTYLRDSECERRGGEALEEPAWAQLDPPDAPDAPDPSEAPE